MPYIKKEERDFWDPKIEELLEAIDNFTHSGELVYVIYKICLKAIGSKLTFQRLNEIKGLLDSAKDEFTRRKMGPHEDKKYATSWSETDPDAIILFTYYRIGNMPRYEYYGNVIRIDKFRFEANQPGGAKFYLIEETFARWLDLFLEDKCILL